MSKKDIEQEVKLRVEEIEVKIKELTKIANANDIDFSINSLNKDFYCEKSIKDDEYLADYAGQGGAWLSSSDFC
jgi:hypothetical protein